jgi:SAM-dependent methyltransferase
MSPSAYDRLTVNSPNPAARFAQRSRHERGIRLVKQHLSPSSAILDYGSNNGDFLNTLAGGGWTGPLYGYDPYVTPKAPSFTPVGNLGEIPDEVLDAVLAFETLEHVDDHVLEEFISFCERSLRAGGVLIISVPIMVGPILLLKYPNAVFINKSRWRYSARELFRAAILWQQVPRSKSGAYLDHKGFDYRVLRQRLVCSFAPISIGYSPFPGLGPALNSQAFMCFRAMSTSDRI